MNTFLGSKAVAVVVVLFVVVVVVVVVAVVVVSVGRCSRWPFEGGASSTCSPPAVCLKRKSKIELSLLILYKFVTNNFCLKRKSKIQFILLLFVVIIMSSKLVVNSQVVKSFVLPFLFPP